MADRRHRCTKPGENTLEIKVTNQWTNRLAGDRELPADKKILGRPGSAFGGGSNRPPPPLPESGLLGPVTLVSKPVLRVADAPDAKVADVPVNYTEAKVGHYTLPDPLKLVNGQSVQDAKTWTDQRRPELVALSNRTSSARCPDRRRPQL